jgi:hypothetical protein
LLPLFSVSPNDSDTLFLSSVCREAFSTFISFSAS